MFGNLPTDQDNDLPFLAPSIITQTFERPTPNLDKKVGVRGRPKGEKNSIRKK